MPAKYSYVIVGAGSAGCVLANRLTEDEHTTVLLLEAGPPDTLDAIHEPGQFQQTWGSEWAWQYYTEEEPRLLQGPESIKTGRKVFWPRGRTLGGSSSISSMIYLRGNRRDYDTWSYLGNEGWDYNRVLPYFKKSEDNSRGASRDHGAGGPMGVSDISAPNPVSRQFVKAAIEVGYPRGSDFNDGEQRGAGMYQVNVKDGRRVSGATAFLDPIRDKRKNLTIINYARTRRILFDGSKASGVEYELTRASPGTAEAATAENEVIVSCGSVDSPKLLMLSGIGPAGALQKHGIRVVQDLPGVGQNLHDHTIIGIGYRYADGKGSAPPAAGAVEGGLFVRTRAGLEAGPPDIQFHFSHWMLLDRAFLGSLNPTAGFSLVPTLVRPQSRGSIGIRSANVQDPPVIHANYLESDADLRALVEAVKIGQEILHASPFDGWRGVAVAPDKNVHSTRDIEQYIRRACAGLFHPVGTCKMGYDDMAVVDPQLRVHGVKNLRVVDASIMPTIVGGNTHAPTTMIGEKAADLIRNGPPR